MTKPLTEGNQKANIKDWGDYKTIPVSPPPPPKPKKQDLISLGDFNTLKAKDYFYSEKNEFHYNGIACPKCGNELCDASHLEVFTSFPPRYLIYCPKRACGFRGYRII